MANLELRKNLFEQLTGNSGDVSGRAGGSIRSMLMAIGGRSTRTKSGIDLSKAAAELGVSRRTTERWLKAAEGGTGNRPSGKHQRSMARKAAAKATTKKGRRESLAGNARVEQMRRYGAQVKVAGMQGPMSYERNRITSQLLTSEDIGQMLSAWEQGGESAAMQWLTGFWATNYMQSEIADESVWRFGPEEFELEITSTSRLGR